jgi:hypothetical protein
MPNLRVIYDNAADRATLSASSSVGALVAANLKSDLKSVVWRSTSAGIPAATLDLSWPTAEMIAGVALPYCNLSAQAAIRVRGTNEDPATNYISYSSLRESSGVYQIFGGNITDNGVVAGSSGPDGVAGVRRLTVGTPNGSSTVRFGDTGSGTPGTVYCASIFLRTPDGVPRTITLDCCDGTVQQVTLDGAWRRLSANSANMPAGMTYRFFDIQFLSSGAYEMFGAQLQTGLVPDSYYPNTTNAPATRPLGYMDSWQSYNLDTLWVYACPGAPFGLWGWGTAPLGANAYAYGGGNLARAWIAAPAAVRALRIEITDAGNPGGYIEAARLVCGAYWEPAKNADYGASAQPLDASKNFRNDAGDLMSDQGSRSVKLALPMTKLEPVDRAKLFSILRGNGITRPVFVSVFPNDADTAREQDHQLYGKLVTTPSMTLPSFNLAAATLEIESI